MFVITLIMNDGRLKRTAIARNANEAVDIAHQWYKIHKNDEASEVEGRIFIDQQIKGQNETNRFAIIRLDQEPNEVSLYLSLNEQSENSPIFTSRYAAITKTFLIAFLEYALVKLTEYLQNKHNPTDKGSR